MIIVNIMSFIFTGLCFVCVGILIFKRKEISLLQSTKDLLKHMGIYVETTIKIEKQETPEETPEELNNEKLIKLVNDKIQLQKDKEIFNNKLKLLCEEIKSKNINQDTGFNNMLVDWIEKLKYYGGFENNKESEFIVVDETDVNSDKSGSIKYDSEEECQLPERSLTPGPGC